MEEEKKSEQDVKSVLQEDKDNVVSANEIARIFRIYLGRPATEEETARFEGLRESEWKVLEGYVKEAKAQADARRQKDLDGMKIKSDLENKRMKANGERMLNSLPSVPGNDTPAGADAIPAGEASLPPLSAETPTQGAARPNRYIRDGRYFLVSFK